MFRLGVRAFLVVRDLTVIGMVTAEDIRQARRAGAGIDGAGEVMTEASDMPAIDWQTLRDATGAGSARDIRRRQCAPPRRARNGEHSAPDSARAGASQPHRASDSAGGRRALAGPWLPGLPLNCAGAGATRHHQFTSRPCGGASCRHAPGFRFSCLRPVPAAHRRTAARQHIGTAGAQLRAHRQAHRHRARAGAVAGVAPDDRRAAALGRPAAASPRRGHRWRGSISTGGTLTLTEAGSKRRASLHLLGATRLAASIRAASRCCEPTLCGFRAAPAAENHTLKRALTDPHLFSGIGNAYSDEILHHAQAVAAGADPQARPTLRSRACSSQRATLERMDRAAARGGWREFPRGVTAFRPDMAVHGRFGQPCPVAARRCSAFATPITRPITVRAARPKVAAGRSCAVAACSRTTGRGRSMSSSACSRKACNQLVDARNQRVDTNARREARRHKQPVANVNVVVADGNRFVDTRRRTGCHLQPAG